MFAFKEAKEAKALLTKLVDHKDNMCSNTVKMKTFADKMKSKPQAEAVKKEAEKIYKDFPTFFDKQQANLDKKLSENPDSLRDTNEDDSLSTEPRSNPRSTQLKRLSLPVFSGAKMEYMRFKQEFKDHVKYENEKDRLYALKYECVKPADRKKIANLKTVKECFDVLDKTYGNTSLAAQGALAHRLQRRPRPTHNNAKSGAHPCSLPLGFSIAWCYLGGWGSGSKTKKSRTVSKCPESKI